MDWLLPLLNHINEVDNTPLDDLDMIGSAVKYDELSPNWKSVLDSIDIRPRNLESNEFSWTYALQTPEYKPVKFVAHNSGRYSKRNKVSLLEDMLWHALKHNRKIDPYCIRFQDTPLPEKPYHPIHLLTKMQERDAIGVTLSADWYVDEERELMFPRHKLILVGADKK